MSLVKSRLRDCFYKQIIGAKHYLEYGEQVELGRGVWKPDPNWTKLLQGSVSCRYLISSRGRFVA